MKKATLYFIPLALVVGMAVSLFNQSTLSNAQAACHSAPTAEIAMATYGPENFQRSSSKTDYKRLYNVRFRYSKRITVPQVNEARVINDFLPYYPGGWIVEYHEVKIIAHIGKETKVVSAPDNRLTAEQLELLRTLKPLDGIYIKIRYSSKNAVTGEMEPSMLEYALGITPDINAEFKGGRDALVNYLAENSWDEIVANGYDASDMKTTGIRFTINLEGKAEDIEVFVPSGNDKVDEILKETVENMPAWIPAENFDGEKAKQQFEFILGDGC